MRSTSLLTLLAAALLAAPLSSAFAEDKPVTIPARDTWKAGDVATKKSTESKKEKRTVKDAEGNVIAAASAESEEKTEYEVVMKVLEATAEGRPTRRILYFKSYSRTADGKTDTSLQGKHVEVSGSGDATKTSVVGGGAATAVGTWLDEEFGKGAAKNEERHALLVPDKPVSKGASWDLPMDKVTASMGDGKGEGMKFVAEKSTGKMTLVDTMGDVGQFKLEMSLQAAPIENAEVGTLEWKEGGAVTILAEGIMPLNPADHGEMSKSSTKFSGTASNENVVVEILVESETETTAEPGGEMPEPAK